MMKKLLIFYVLLFFISWPALSAEKKKAQRGRVVEVNFNDELLIKGKLLGPSLFTLYQKRNVEFGKLIQPRKDFLPEMRTTKGDIE